jgi:hypothetical protein
VGVHICHIGLRGHDARGEWVEIANDGPAAISLTGLEVTDYTTTQQRPHIYRFPLAVGDGNLMLSPGNSAFLFSGPGEGARLDDGDLLLFWNLQTNVWNDSGDVAYLRRTSDGTFVDHMTVGSPKRHPGGH